MPQALRLRCRKAKVGKIKKRFTLSLKIKWWTRTDAALAVEVTVWWGWGDTPNQVMNDKIHVKLQLCSALEWRGTCVMGRSDLDVKVCFFKVVTKRLLSWELTHRNQLREVRWEEFAQQRHNKSKGDTARGSRREEAPPLSLQCALDSWLGTGQTCRAL